MENTPVVTFASKIPSVQDHFHLWRLPWLKLQFLRVDHIQEIVAVPQGNPLSLQARDSTMLC